MKKARFVRVDVFTKEPFGGNPLAVFPHAEGLTANQMQLLAKEMNLSETTFVVPATKGSGADFRVRIFVPDMEIPYAGHPTLGTFFVLASEGRIKLSEPMTVVQMESGAGVLPVEIHSKNGRITRVVTVQSKPIFGPAYHNLGLIARALSLEKSDIEKRAPIQLVSTGLPWVIVPLRSRKAVQRASGNSTAFIEAKKILPKKVVDMYVTCLDPLEHSSTTHSRAFSLVSGGIVEDPATGSASGCLGAYLVRWKLVPVEPVTKIVNEQGHEIGRPSKIAIEVRTSKGSIESVRVGGPVVHMMDGTAYF